MALDSFEREPETKATPSESQSSAAFNQSNDITQNPDPLAENSYPDEPYQPARVSNVQKNYRPTPSKQVPDKTNSASTAAKVSGAASLTTGAMVQGTGKTINAGGKVMTRAGAALSGTGVGALVGVPLAATGAAISGAGKGLDKSGKIFKNTGKVVKKTGKQTGLINKQYGRVARENFLKKGVASGLKHNPLLQQRRNRLSASSTENTKEIKARAKSRARILMIIGWVVSFPVAIFNALFIYFFYAYTEVQDGGVWDIVKSAATLNVSEAATKTAIYFYPEQILAFIIICWAIGFTLSVVFLLAAFSNLNSIGAQTKNSAIKTGLFLTALVAAFIPMANVWPWANTWIRHVGKHPE